MDFAATRFFEPGGSEVRQRHKRIALGVAVSLAMHALLLTAYRTGTVRDAAGVETQPPRSIVVLLRPPPPPPSEERFERLTRPSLPRANTAPKEKPRRVIAVPREPAAPAQPGSYVAQQPQPDESTAPRFDIEAARHTARQLANQPDPSKAGTALAQFPEPPLQTESKAARAIGAAKRRDCKDGIPGGLLAPLLLLKDKKDSGCKW